jgi:hypothetical protein
MGCKVRALRFDAISGATVFALAILFALILTACGGGSATAADIREADIAVAETAVAPASTPFAVAEPVEVPTKGFDPPTCAKRPEVCQ